MKMKLKFSVGGIKNLLIQHGEKAAFAIAGLLFLLYVSSAMRTEVLGPDRSSDKLKNEAEVARKHVLESTWDPKAKEIEVVDYPARAKPARLNDTDYRLAIFFNKPIWETKSKRPEPKLLPVEELLAMGGNGVLALQPDEDAEEGGPIGGGMGRLRQAIPRRGPVGEGEIPPARAGAAARGRKGDRGRKAEVVPGVAEEDEDVRPMTSHSRSVNIEPKGVRGTTNANLKGYSWVVVTGLVPEKKQTDEFEEAYRNVIYPNPNGDVPEWYGQHIERCEIGADGKQTAWQELNAKELDIFLERQVSPGKEVVDEAYLSLYSWSLGALVGEDWTYEMAGHPKIPRAPERNALGQLLDSETRKNRSTEPTSDEEEDEERSQGARGRGGRTRGMRGMSPSRGSAMRPPMGEEEGMPSSRGTRGGAGGRGRMVEGMGMGELERTEPDNTLFRFVDYTVQPGKKYRYRVKLSLYNPNYELPPKYLKDQESAKRKRLETDWSKETPDVVVPYDETIVAGHVAPKSSPRDPQAEVAVVKTDREKGLRPATVEVVSRGTVANFKKPEVWVPDGSRTQELRYKDVDFQSNILVVDIQGGNRLDPRDRSLTSPVDLLVLQPDGRLRVHDELAEAEDFEQYKPEEEEDSRGGRGAEDSLRGAPAGSSPYGEGRSPRVRGGQDGRRGAEAGGTRRALPAEGTAPPRRGTR